MTFIPAIDVPVIISYGNLETTGEITGLSIGEALLQQPVAVNTTLTSQGNHHFKASNEITLTDQTGAIIADCDSLTTTCSIIPGYSFVFQRILEIPPDLTGGKYTLESIVTMEDGTELKKQAILEFSQKAQQTVQSTGAVKNQVSGNEEPRGISWSFVGIAIGGMLIIGLLIVLIGRSQRNGNKD